MGAGVAIGITVTQHRFLLKKGVFSSSDLN